VKKILKGSSRKRKLHREINHESKDYKGFDEESHRRI
jgi:hypothetical protein